MGRTVLHLATQEFREGAATGPAIVSQADPRGLDVAAGALAGRCAPATRDPEFDLVTVSRPTHPDVTHRHAHAPAVDESLLHAFVDEVV